MKLDALLQVNGLSKYFIIERSIVNSVKGFISNTKPNRVNALNNVSFSVGKQEILGILGESGSGKSTLARVIMGIYKPDAGNAQLDGCEVFSSNKQNRMEILKQMQIVFQDPFASLDPRMTIRQILSEPLKIHSIPAKGREEFLVKTLSEVGLDETVLDRYPSEFSGGQRQRIGICRSLMLDPKLIIADEAVSALDVSVQAQILNLLHSLKEMRKLSMIFISHDVAVVRQFADRVILLYRGHIVEEMKADCLLNDAFHPYSKKLLASAIFLREGKGRAIKHNEVETITNTDGCPYFDSCDQSHEACHKTPQYFEIHAGHKVACWLAKNK